MNKGSKKVEDKKEEDQQKEEKDKMSVKMESTTSVNESKRPAKKQKLVSLLKYFI
jgi:GMP synthase-like glutamine amidotransferase